MTLKLTVGLVAVLGLPVLITTVLGQTPRPDPPPRATYYRSSGAGQSVGGLTVTSDGPSQDLRTPEPVIVETPSTVTSGVHAITTRRGDFYFSPLGMNNEEAGLAHESDQLARKLGDAKSDTDRSKIKEDLAQILEKQFDLRQKRHLDEIKALEEKIKKLKGLVDKRQENRREIVSNRLDQIMRDAMGLGW